MADYILPIQAPYPQAVVGWDGTDFRVFAVDAAGQLQVDVVASGLPAGAATAANQALILSRFQDQAFTYLEQYIERFYTGAAAAGPNTHDYAVVDPGEVWIITSVLAANTVTASSVVEISVRIGANNYYLRRRINAPIGQEVCWAGNVYLEPGDFIRTMWAGCAAGDDLWGTVTGYKMTRD